MVRTPHHGLLLGIKRLIKEKRYRIKIHAVRHMVEEGFSEKQVVNAISGRSRILENYEDDNRCLILGTFYFAERTKCHLHIVCDYSDDTVVDIITAYIPQKPWWKTPTQRKKSP
jgi:hypothetical protein